MSTPLDKFYYEIRYFDICAQNISFVMHDADLTKPDSYLDVFFHIDASKESLGNALKHFKNLAPKDQQAEAYILLESTYKFRKMSRGLFKFITYTKDVMYDTIEMTFEPEDDFIEYASTDASHISTVYKDILFKFDLVWRLIESSDKSVVENGFNRVTSLLESLESLIYLILSSNYTEQDKSFLGKELSNMLVVITILQNRAVRRLDNG